MVARVGSQMISFYVVFIKMKTSTFKNERISVGGTWRIMCGTGTSKVCSLITQINMIQ